MERFHTDSRTLMDALTSEAQSRVPGSRLISVEFQPLRDTEANEGDAEVSVRTLKASTRICFLQGMLSRNEMQVLKARAIFRKS